MKKPTFPRDGAELRRRVLAEYSTLSSPAALTLLGAACEALDERRTAAEQLQREGLTVSGSIETFINT